MSGRCYCFAKKTKKVTSVTARHGIIRGSYQHKSTFFLVLEVPMSSMTLKNSEKLPFKLSFKSLESTELEVHLKEALYRAWRQIPKTAELKVYVTISENSITIELPRVITFFAHPRSKPSITLYDCEVVSRNILSVASSNNTLPMEPMVAIVDFSSRHP